MCFNLEGGNDVTTGEDFSPQFRNQVNIGYQGSIEIEMSDTLLEWVIYASPADYGGSMTVIAGRDMIGQGSDLEGLRIAVRAKYDDEEPPTHAHLTFEDMWDEDTGWGWNVRRIFNFGAGPEIRQIPTRYAFLPTPDLPSLADLIPAEDLQDPYAIEVAKVETLAKDPTTLYMWGGLDLTTGNALQTHGVPFADSTRIVFDNIE